MKSKSLAGIVLIVLGVIALAYQGITYTTHKKVLDIGSTIQATKEEHETIPLAAHCRRGSPHRRRSASLRRRQRFIDSVPFIPSRARGQTSTVFFQFARAPRSQTRKTHRSN